MDLVLISYYTYTSRSIRWKNLEFSAPEKKMLQYCIFLVKGSTVNEFQNYILVHDMTENWFVTWLTVWFAFQKKIADPGPDRVGGLKRRGDNKLYLRFIFSFAGGFSLGSDVFSLGLLIFSSRRLAHIPMQIYFEWCHVQFGHWPI